MQCAINCDATQMMKVFVQPLGNYTPESYAALKAWEAAPCVLF